MTTLRRWAVAAGRVLRTVLGAPDYERYRAHVRRHHPGQEPLTRAAFLRARQEERYRTPGGRCC